MIDYNLILYIGLGFITLGFLLFIVSIIMDRHYEVKLWELNQKMKELNKKAERVLK
mgnify:CR=1 FL=1